MHLSSKRCFFTLYDLDQGEDMAPLFTSRPVESRLEDMSVSDQHKGWAGELDISGFLRRHQSLGMPPVDGLIVLDGPERRTTTGRGSLSNNGLFSQELVERTVEGPACAARMQLTPCFPIQASFQRHACLTGLLEMLSLRVSPCSAMGRCSSVHSLGRQAGGTQKKRKTEETRRPKIQCLVHCTES